MLAVTTPNYIASRAENGRLQRIGPRSQTGVILVVVVGAVVLMVTLLALMIEDQHMLVRRISNQKVSEQGYQYAQGLNAWAERVLHDDKNREIDYLGEKWAEFGRPPPEPVEGESESFSLDLSSRNEQEEEKEAVVDFGFDGLEVSIDDLQGRFNLNNLGPEDPKQLQGQKRIFLNLLEILEVGEFDERQLLVDSLVDWIDENDARTGLGLESGDYGIKKTPYYAADQKLTSLGELRFVEGFTEEIIKKLKPYVTVLPVGNAAININTTTPEVLASLSAGTVSDLGSVQQFLALREDPNFIGFNAGQLEQAKTAIIGVSVVPSQPIPGMLQVKSQFFQINSKVSLGDSVYCMETVVLREGASEELLTAPKVSVLNRQHNTLCEEESPTTTESDEDIP